ncbi:CU044_2847 family protein [Nonomuraea sp. NPDC003707]
MEDDRTHLLDVPVEGGGRLLVEMAAGDLPEGLDLAAAPPGAVVARARESLESSLGHLTPALQSLSAKFRALKPDAVTVEFGITLSTEVGVVVAKGSSEVHFAVTLSWEASASDPAKTDAS